MHLALGSKKVFYCLEQGLLKACKSSIKQSNASRYRRARHPAQPIRSAHHVQLIQGISQARGRSQARDRPQKGSRTPRTSDSPWKHSRYSSRKMELPGGQDSDEEPSAALVPPRRPPWRWVCSWTFRATAPSAIGTWQALTPFHARLGRLRKKELASHARSSGVWKARQTECFSTLAQWKQTAPERPSLTANVVRNNEDSSA